MPNSFVNQDIIRRFDELIADGQRHYKESKNGRVADDIMASKWITSSLNLLDKLSVSSNRFVKEFERWVPNERHDTVNFGPALGVLMAAKEEYILGFAIDYHLGVVASVFGDLQEQAMYLFEKEYFQAAVVLTGAALEEALKVRAKTVPIELSGKETLIPLIHKLKSPEVSILTDFQARQLEVFAKLRNDAAHGGNFNYEKNEIENALNLIANILRRLLGEK